MPLFEFKLTKEELEKEKNITYRRFSKVADIKSKYEGLIKEAEQNINNRYIKVSDKNKIAWLIDNDADVYEREDSLGSLLKCTCGIFLKVMEEIQRISINYEIPNSLIDNIYIVNLLNDDMYMLFKEIMHKKDLENGFYFSNVEYIKLKLLAQLCVEYDNLVNNIDIETVLENLPDMDLDEKRIIYEVLNMQDFVIVGYFYINQVLPKGKQLTLTANHEIETI